MEPPKPVVTPQVPPQAAPQTWYPKEHGDKAEEAGYEQKRKPPTPEETAQYEKEYVYGSHLQPGLERSPTYLTPREREVQEGKGQQLYEKSIEERSGIAVRAEQRKIGEQQYQERLNQIPARGVQGPVPFGALAEQSWQIAVKSDVQLRGMVQRAQSRLVMQPQVERPLSRWSELKDFGQDIANVKANAGASSLTQVIEQYAETRYSKDVVTRTMQKTGFLPSQASSLMKVAGAVSTVESYINPNVPSLFELGSKSPEFIIGRLTGEAMLMAFSGELFSWMTKGTPSPIKWKGSRPESWLIEHSDWYAKRAAKSISYGLMDVPDVNVVKPVSLAGLEAEATATTLAVAPHTGMLDPLLLIPQELPITERLFALPSLPYLPEFSAIKGSSFLPRLIGASTMLGLGFASLSKTSQQPKQVERLKAFQESFSIPSLKSLSLMETRTKQRQVPALLLGLSLAQETKQVSAIVSVSSLALETKQVQRQIQRLTSEFKTPSLQRGVTTFKFPGEEPFIRKHKKRGRKGVIGLFSIGEFFYPEPPTYEQVFGKPSKRRHKKR